METHFKLASDRYKAWDAWIRNIPTSARVLLTSSSLFTRSKNRIWLTLDLCSDLDYQTYCGLNMQKGFAGSCFNMRLLNSSPDKRPTIYWWDHESISAD